MKKAPLAVNELQRIQALHQLNLLDTPNEERFDKITRLAQKVLNVETVLISLVDTNRQWFKSRVNLDVPETPRDISFCGHAITESTTLHIPDTHQDERFADNPLVTHQPFIRMYAGAQLREPDSQQVIGTLCLIDYKPRQLTSSELEILREFADIAEEQLTAQIKLNDLMKELIPTAVCKDGVFEQCNYQCAELFDLATESSLTGRSLLDFSPDQQDLNLSSEEKLHNELRALQRNQHQQFEWRLNDDRWLQINLTNVNINNETHVLAQFIDITDSKKHQQFLIHTARNVAMDKMLHMMVHQWKQPLTVVMANLSILETDLLNLSLSDVQQTMWLAMFKDINDMLDVQNTIIQNFERFYSASEAKDCFKLKQVIRLLIAQIQGLSDTVEVDISNIEPNSEILGVMRDFEQVMFIILKNSLDQFQKKTIKKPKISIASETLDGLITLTIEDNAGGFEEELSHKLFDPYYSSKSLNGSGLGLYFAKTILETVFGGHITAENTPKGARFNLIIPLQ